jgi:hypothetical protein
MRTIFDGYLKSVLSGPGVKSESVKGCDCRAERIENTTLESRTP